MPFSANERQILGITSAAHFLSHLYELAFPVIALTLKDDLGWSLGDVLRLSFCMYLLYGIGSLPMGMITDRWRARWMITVCMLGAGAGAIAVALAAGKVQLVASLALMGLCSSIYHPAGMALLSRTVRERGRALGLNGVFGNLGSASAPFLAGLLAYEFGWRAAYATLGGLGIAAGLVSLFVVVDETTPAGGPVQEPAGGGGRSSLGLFAILCVAVVFGGFSYRGVSLVLPAAFKAQSTFFAALLERLRFAQLAGVTNLAAATLASISYAAGILGQVWGGHLADRHDLRKLYLLFQVCSLPFLVAMAFAHEGALLAVACGYVFFSLGMQPIENSLVARFTPARWRSTGYGVKFVLNFGIGASAVYAVSALQAGGSFVPVFLTLGGVVVLLCATVALLLHRSRGIAVRNHPGTVPTTSLV